MKIKIKHLLLSLGIGILTLNVNAQQVNTLYFLENAPVRHYMNPSFQPLSGFYFGLPVLGYSQFGIGNNSLVINSLTLDKPALLNSLRPTTLIRTDLQLNLLDFGFRYKDAYWSFSLTEKVDAQLGLSKDLFKLLMFGTENIESNTFDMSSMNINMNAYTEAALGYSRNLGNKWAIGGKLKLLYGTANLAASFNDFKLNAGIDEWSVKANGIINSSSPAQLEIADNFQSINQSADFSNPGTYTNPAGIGGAIDLGVTFKPFNGLSLAAAVTDLGMIRWNNNVNNVNADLDYAFQGVEPIDGEDIFGGNVNSTALVDSILSNLDKSYNTSVTKKAYTTYTSPKINISAEYGVWDNKLSLGLLSRTMVQKKAMYEELTASLNLRPANWFNMALSYSVLNGRASNLGAGIGMRIGFINAFFAADYIPVLYAPLPLSEIGMSSVDVSNVPLISSYGTLTEIPVPHKTDRFNFTMGFNIVFGNKQDKDHDGVKNRKDKCPGTPRNVVVDKNGCPVDTDGDGVADYLDKCENTPVEAFGHINSSGCPLDSDGDGVFDYLDKCADTPAEARGFIDSNGCPMDTDGDGVYDYLDKCQNSPTEARGFVDAAGCPTDKDKDGVFDYMDKCPDTPDSVSVDSLGCPLDEDGDGVADYLDLCPKSPAEARGMVDKNGCPLDSDDDGVYDYLDLCNNTALAARGFIDKNGCPLDSDDDGVADYLDKCPKTPVEARGMVDENGCPRDTDSDGVADYLDNCPKLAGVASNYGCPEIKKEVRTLFQKALQGIQFESAKDIIKKSSNPILDQIAKVLIANPTYLIEVQGHTDNVGKPALNQLLSEKRAIAVRNYLISKGVTEDRITAKGYGDTKPVASNKTTQGKAKNRRVEFVVTFEEVKFE